MKTSKKILAIILSLGLTMGVSYLIALSLNLIFGTSIFGTTIGLSMLQILWSIYYDKYVEYNLLKNAVEEYTNKPFKRYIIPLQCQFCGKTDNIEIDLNNTEYKCSNCRRPNAVYVTFATAAIYDPSK